MGNRGNFDRRAYWVVDDFEEELCRYTGAPFACAVDSCTNGLFLALKFVILRYLQSIHPKIESITIPRFTYPGVMHSIFNAGYEINFCDPESVWQKRGWFPLSPLNVIDSARNFHKNCYIGGSLQVLSFHSAKQMPSGGGAILTDDEEAYNWIQRAKNDGRAPGEYYSSGPGFHMTMTPPDAARGLWMLSRFPDKPAPLPYEPNYPDLSKLIGA